MERGAPGDRDCTEAGGLKRLCRITDPGRSRTPSLPMSGMRPPGGTFLRCMRHRTLVLLSQKPPPGCPGSNGTAGRATPGPGELRDVPEPIDLTRRLEDRSRRCHRRPRRRRWQSDRACRGRRPCRCRRHRTSTSLGGAWFGSTAPGASARSGCAGAGTARRKHRAARIATSAASPAVRGAGARRAGALAIGGAAIRHARPRDAITTESVCCFGRAGAEDELAHRLIAREVSADQPGAFKDRVHRTGRGREGGRARDADRRAALQVGHKRHAVLAPLGESPGSAVPSSQARKRDFLNSLEGDAEVRRPAVARSPPAPVGDRLSNDHGHAHRSPPRPRPRYTAGSPARRQ